MGRASLRNNIIEAAERLVTRVGAAHLTLDAVAEEAGVSKGGLLYHFKTKNELLQAILTEHINSKMAALEEVKRRDAAEGSTELESHLHAVFDVLCGSCTDREKGVALLAAVANNPELLQPFQEHFDSLSDRLWGKRSRFNPDAAILWLAAEGLRFFTLLNHDPFIENQREAVISRLLERARQIEIPPGSSQQVLQPDPGEIVSEN